MLRNIKFHLEQGLIGNLSIFDSFIIISYLLVTLLIVLYYFKDREQTSEDYFLAGRNAGWLAVGMSLFATNISSEHIVGLAGAGASRGLAVGQFEWFAIFILIFLGWICAPIFLKSKVFTIPQFFSLRYDERSGKYLTVVSIIAYILTKISVTLFAGGLLLKEVLGWDMFTSAIVMVLLTGLYTIAGGMYSVMYTQIFQTIVIIIGSLLLTLFGLKEVGGLTGLASKLPADFFNLMKPMSDPDFPWTGIIFGAPILAVWYWCTDQYIVQRVLSAKSIQDARRGTLLTAFLKIFPVFIFVLPGLIAVALYPEITGDSAFPFLVTSNLLPNGVKGFVVAGLIAALMSSLASVIHSTATLYTFDIYKPKHPESSDRKLVLVGRLAATVIVVSAILWVPLIKIINANVYIYLQSVQSYIAPPIAAVFLFGIFWEKASNRGAILTLYIGGFIGLLRLISDLLAANDIVQSGFLLELSSINYLHFAIILFVISSVTIIINSLLADEYEKIELLSEREVFIGTHMISRNGLTISKNGIKKVELYLFALIILTTVFFWGVFA